MPIFLPALGLATLVAVNTDGAGPEAGIAPEPQPFCSAEAGEPGVAKQVLAELSMPGVGRAAAEGGARHGSPAPAPIDGAAAEATRAPEAPREAADPPGAAAPGDER